MSFGFEFSTVRVLCQDCGWYRNIGYSGIKDNVRALIRISESRDPSHILHGSVLEFPISESLENILATHPDYRDLEAEAQRKGLFPMLDEFKPLLVSRCCPRCKKQGHLCLDSATFHGKEIRF
jgi:hypothetical protein